MDSKNIESRTYLDTGWAWFCLAGAVFMNSIISGIILRSFSLMFDKIQEYYDSSAEDVAFLPSMAASLMMIVGLPANALAVRFGTRRVVMIGGMCTSLGFLMSSFVGNVYLLYITYGLLIGIGTGLVLSPSIVLVTTYFVKYRSLANGIIGAGAGIGGILYTPIIMYFLENYSVTEMFLLISGVTLNLVVCGCLLRPISFYNRKYKNIRHNIILNEKISIPDLKINIIVNDDFIKSSSDYQKKETNAYETKKNRSMELYLAKDIVLVIYCITYALILGSFVSSYVIIAPHLKNLGYSNENAAIVIQIMGASDIITRIVMGIIAGSDFIKKDIIYIITLFSASLSFFGVTLSNNLYAVSFFSTIGISACGAVVCLMPTLCCEVFKQNHMPTTYGLMSIISGFWIFVFLIAMGKLRDITNDWNMSFMICSLMAMIAGCLQLTVIFLKKNKIHKKFFVDEKSVII